MSEMNFYTNCKVAEFKAPETNNYRQVVMDYMMKMADFEWTPKETFHIKPKNSLDFGVDLVYEKGKTYHGMTYCDTKSTLDEFMQMFEDGKFVPNSEFYEDCVGNHCSSSMDMAYQQILDFPYAGSLQPGKPRGTMIKLAGELKIPEEWGDNYDAEDIWKGNSKEKVLSAFAALDMGDVLYFSSKKRSGHVRMVSKRSEVVRFENGKIDPDNSFAYTIEQTNTWDTQDTARGRNTTWFVNRKRSFSVLYERFFMPITFSIFTSGERSKDAYIYYCGTNNAETLKNGITGTVTSTFPLTYARATVRDKDGKLVASALRNNLIKHYTLDLAELNGQLDLSLLKKGTYTMTIRAGIARGGADFEKFEFTV